jgi:hypothetical protein
VRDMDHIVLGTRHPGIIASFVDTQVTSHAAEPPGGDAKRDIEQDEHEGAGASAFQHAGSGA